jgi:Protein of unknown function (DUF3800)
LPYPPTSTSMSRFDRFVPAERAQWSASSVGRLAMSLFPAAPNGRSFVILTAYYDESGTHGGSPVTVLAGFVGSSDEWVHFEREWSKVLRKHKITHVRAKHLFHRQKQHKGWRDDRVNELWADCLYVLQENKQIFASKTILKEEDYRLFYVSDGPAKRERLDTQYALCFRSFMHFLPSAHYSAYATGAINFVLEAGHRNAGDAVRVFNEIKEDKKFPGRDAIGFLTFGKKQDSCALQAADMLAYWVYGAEREMIEDKETGFISEFEDELVASGQAVLEHLITPDDLKNMRMNFLRKRKRKVLERFEITAGTKIVDALEPALKPKPYYDYGSF